MACCSCNIWGGVIRIRDMGDEPEKIRDKGDEPEKIRDKGYEPPEK